MNDDSAAQTPIRLLVIEDDLMMARYILAVLDAEGIGHELASSAEQAHHLFLTHAPDGLIVDLVLPGLGGLGLVRELREFRPDLPVLFCTGATDDFNRGLMEPLGMVCHKPLDESFQATLRQFIKRCRRS